MRTQPRADEIIIDLSRALEQRASWLSVEWLPKFSPELNDIERDPTKRSFVWRVLKGKYLGNRNYANEGHLEMAVVDAIARLNADRKAQREAGRASEVV